MTAKSVEIGQFVKLNTAMSDLAIKKAIEDKWIGVDVVLHKNAKAQPPLTMLYIHSENQDNYLMAIISRDSK